MFLSHIISIPAWAQFVTGFNPGKYCAEVLRMVKLKGSSRSYLSAQLKQLGTYAGLTNGLAVWTKKVT